MIDVCAECGKEFDRDEKVVRLEIFPEIIALEAEFCSEKCLIKYLACQFCQHMKQVKPNESQCDQDVCVLDKFPFNKQPEEE